VTCGQDGDHDGDHDDVQYGVGGAALAGVVTWQTTPSGLTTSRQDRPAITSVSITAAGPLMPARPSKTGLQGFEMARLFLTDRGSPLGVWRVTPNLR
jgi:hypothetical protein